MRYFLFFYNRTSSDCQYVTKGNFPFESDLFPRNIDLIYMIKNSGIDSSSNIVITGWQEMKREDFNNFCNIDNVKDKYPVDIPLKCPVLSIVSGPKES